MYAGRVACCPLASHDEHAAGTDGRMPDSSCITLSAIDAASVIKRKFQMPLRKPYVIAVLKMRLIFAC